MQKIGFIGCGNMGGALAQALCKNTSPQKVYLADHDSKKAQKLATKLSVTPTTNLKIAEECDLIFLGVKPHFMADMLADLAGTFRKREDRFILVSMAAGLTTETIQIMAGGSYPVIRIMPNTPALVGEGMIEYCMRDITLREEQAFLSHMSAAGRFDSIEERLIDAASAVAGSGPAWAYMFIEALADGGVACGLPRDKATQYAAQMMLGSAKLLLETGKHPGELKDAVCSPAGSTIQGLRVLEEGGMRGTVIDAVIAACEKNKEMGKG